MENTCRAHHLLTAPRQPLWPQDGRRTQRAWAQSLCAIACEGSVPELQAGGLRTHSLHARHRDSLPWSRPIALARHRAVLTAICPGAPQLSAACIQTRGAVTSPRAATGSGGGCVPRGLLSKRAGAAGPLQRGRKARELGAATRITLAWRGRIPSSWPRGRGESRVPPLSTPRRRVEIAGLGERASLGRGESGSVDKEAERIPGPSAVGGPRRPGDAWEELPSRTSCWGG